MASAAEHRLRQAAKKSQRLDAEAAEARLDLRAAMVAARNELTLQKIGEIVGLSRQRVSQLLEEEGVD